MHSITVKNVNIALQEVLWRVRTSGVREESRNGAVLRLTDPLCITYTQPIERVLFWDTRDANPFFHFMESLWMLAGHNDVGFPSYFAKQIKEYSEDGATLDGAYGYRWRYHFEFDQLMGVIELLKNARRTRRAVLTMWDPMVDLDTIEDRKDIPCNLCAVFQERNQVLDMTVFNRSNDIIWGMCGANAVHMSFLHEYVCRGVGMGQGRYNQISANAHMYLNEQGEKLLEHPYCDNRYADNPELVGELSELPNEFELFNDELDRFMEDPSGDAVFQLDYFNRLVLPMYDTWRAYKEADAQTALVASEEMADCDWKVACQEWLQRRAK